MADLSENNAVQPSEMDRTVIGLSHFVARFSIFLFFFWVCVCSMSLKHKEPFKLYLIKRSISFS